MTEQWHLFLAFLRIGLLGYGGGPSMIPLVRSEVVRRYGWLNDEEFGDVLAIGNTLPGPIVTKMAGYIGYRIGGVLGCANALLAVILPSIVLMILLLTTLVAYKDQAWVEGMRKGVVPVVAVMMATLTWDFVKYSKNSFGWLGALALGVVSYVVIGVLDIHPALLIGLWLILALFRREKKPEEGGGETKAAGEQG